MIIVNSSLLTRDGVGIVKADPPRVMNKDILVMKKKKIN